MTENIRKIAEQMAAMVDHVDCDQGCSFHNQQTLAADWLAPLGGKFALLESHRAAHGDNSDPIQIPVSAFDALLREIRNLTAAREADRLEIEQLKANHASVVADHKTQMSRLSMVIMSRHSDLSAIRKQLRVSEAAREQQGREIAGLRDALEDVAEDLSLMLTKYEPSGSTAEDFARLSPSLNTASAALAAVPPAPVPVATRDVRQKQVADWCAAAFGTDHAASVPQRGIRLAEEAIEAAQAAGCAMWMVHKLVDHVYSKVPGNLAQEIGGVGITLLALAQAAGLRADQEERIELQRVLDKPLAYFAARNQAKNDAGFNVVPPTPATEAPAPVPPVAEHPTTYTALDCTCQTDSGGRCAITDWHAKIGGVAEQPDTARLNAEAKGTAIRAAIDASRAGEKP